MIPVASGVRVWLASGATDLRRGMNGLSLQIQQALQRDPHAGDLYVFRGRRGDRATLCILSFRDPPEFGPKRVVSDAAGVSPQLTVSCQSVERI
jgi:hypothetical protein